MAFPFRRKDAIHPTAKNCRDFLLAVLRICHQAVFAEPLAQEWHDHQSSFASHWRVSMMARKKLLHSLTIPERPKLRVKIEAIVARPKSREAILKDVHLLEAALATDGTIVSLDEEARGITAAVATRVGELRSIIWVNPDKADEQAISWLEEGAKPESKRAIGQYPRPTCQPERRPRL
ncbi:MAG: hypothetical protein FJ272_16295 [Planctomycetes bacterium]|nr:hypothetical protein [Planctomycetota bacterium]